MMSFHDFIHKYKLKYKAASNIRKYEVLKKIGLDSKVGIYLRDGDFSTIYGIVNLHPSRGTHWVCFIKDCYFDPNGCPSSNKLLFHLRKVYKICIFSEYQIQKNDSFCAS